MKRPESLLATLLLTIICTLLNAQPFCAVRNFNLRDGLGANTIAGFSQDKQQLMWFATWNGLCCYDGYRFTTFRDKGGAEEVMATNRILSISTNTEDNILCAAYNKRPYIFDTKQCRYIDIARSIDEKYSVNFIVRKHYTLSNGYTWIVGLNGLNVRIKDRPDSDGEYEIQMLGRDMDAAGVKEINKVMADEQGHEWLSTEKGTLLLGRGIVTRDNIEQLVTVAGRTYAGSTRGKLYIVESNGKLHPIKTPAGVTNIKNMLKVDDATIACATDAGVVVIAAKTGAARLVNVQNPSQPSADVERMFVDSKHNMWVFCAGSGVTFINHKTLSATWIPESVDAGYEGTKSEHPVWLEDKYGTVWLAPANGHFGYYDGYRKQIRPYAIVPRRASGNPVPEIKKWFVDKQKNLWITGTHDLTLVNTRVSSFHTTPIEKGVETRSVCSDSHGMRYAGTGDFSIIVSDANNVRKGYLTPTGAISPAPTKLAGKVYNFMFDKKQRMWISTKGGGLYVREPSGTMRHFTHDDADKYSISCNDVYSVDQDDKGNIWVGTYGNGINLVRESADGTMRFVNVNNEMRQYGKEKYNDVRRITHTKDGVIIVSTTQGLVTFSNRFASPSKIKFYHTTHIARDANSLASTDALQVLVTRSGKIYVATLSGGMQQMKSTNLLADNLQLEEIRLASSDEGIIHSIIEDRKGRLWITRETSLDSYDPATGQMTMYGPNDLGERMEFCEAMASLTPQGEILLATMGGYISFNPQGIKKSSYVPTIIVSSIQYQGETEPRPVLYTDCINIASDQRSFTLNFAVTEYTGNDAVKYAYKVEGVDKDWTYIDNGIHSASFNNFPAGTYKLLVKSTNGDGVWVDNEKVIIIDAAPTFWESIWAKMLYVLIAAGVIYAYVHYTTMRRRAAMEHDMNVMKTTFYTEIGHKLRTPLTLIGGPVTEVLNSETLSDVARKQMEMVRRNARNMLNLVNEMLEHGSADNYIVDDENIPVFEDNQTTKQPNDQTTKRLNDQTTKRLNDLRLLIVEDNDDLRAFLASILSDQYAVLQAENGQRGLELAKQEIPDFIITDVMMPVMDGLTMVHLIKEDKDICHIPIIVLSAKASMQDRLQGLNEGIDDYITKPFSATYLRHRVENIIAQRRALQQTFLEQLTPGAVDAPAASDDVAATDSTADTGSPAETAPAPSAHEEYRLEPVQIVDADKEMMKNLMAYLEENISNAELKIEDLANAMNLGRTVFYEKIRSIVGMSPIDFLRHIRLQRAEELITKSNETFSQIAYAVGFTDPKYFSKCFKKQTGMTPSEYRNSVKKKDTGDKMSQTGENDA